MYGYRCPECGAFLDPGEKCDCAIERGALPSTRSARVSEVKAGAAVEKIEVSVSPMIFSGTANV